MPTKPYFPYLSFFISFSSIPSSLVCLSFLNFSYKFFISFVSTLLKFWVKYHGSVENPQGLGKLTCVYFPFSILSLYILLWQVCACKLEPEGYRYDQLLGTLVSKV